MRNLLDIVDAIVDHSPGIRNVMCDEDQTCKLDIEMDSNRDMENLCTALRRYPNITADPAGEIPMVEITTESEDDLEALIDQLEASGIITYYH